MSRSRRDRGGVVKNIPTPHIPRNPHAIDAKSRCSAGPMKTAAHMSDGAQAKLKQLEGESDAQESEADEPDALAETPTLPKLSLMAIRFSVGFVPALRVWVAQTSNLAGAHFEVYTEAGPDPSAALEKLIEVLVARDIISM